MKRIFIPLLFSFFCFNVFAQTYYHTDTPLPCIDKKFTIVAHLVKDSFGLPGIDTTVIKERILELNDLFAPICASFEVCEFRYIDNFQYDDIDMPEDWPEMQKKYHAHNRINLYFVTNPGGNEFGFATQQGIGIMDSGGVVVNKILSAFTLSKVIPHHMGHFFGLLDTYETEFGSELVNTSNCATTGDLICDTPADPYTEMLPLDAFLDIPNNPCSFIYGGKDANDEYYVPDVANLMSFFGFTCGCTFSNDQYTLMALNFLSDPRMW